MGSAAGERVQELVKVDRARDPAPNFNLWRAGCKRVLAGVDYASTARNLFGELLAVDLAGGRLWNLHADEQTIYRTRPSPGRRFAPMAVVQVSGHSRLTQFGKVSDLTGGTFAFLDSAAPLTIENFDVFEQIYLHFPPATFAPAEFQKVVGVPADPGWSLDRGFANAVREIWDVVPRLRLDQHSAALASLVSLGTLTSPFSLTGEEKSVPVRVTRAMAFIEQHLGESWLTPQHVADAQRVSRRYLDDLFSPFGHRIGSWIWERRLLRAAEELRSYGQMSGAGGKSILQVTLDLGFKSPSHFSRVFAARFGATPSKYRTQIGARGDAAPPPRSKLHS